MKKILPFFLGLLLFAGLFYVVMTTKAPPKQMDERITMKGADKIPYGFYATRELIAGLFPDTKITTSDLPPSSWYTNKKPGPCAMILVAKEFQPDKEELDQVLQYAKTGNYVFIITPQINSWLESATGLSSYYSFFRQKDSLRIALINPRFTPSSYEYRGKDFAGFFVNDTDSKALVLGENDRGNPNFVQMRVGNGMLFVNLAAPAFSNYFVLSGNNAEYISKAFSVLPPNLSTVTWNEYFNTHHTKEAEPNWLGVLWRYPALRWALITGVITILLYLILEMRRKQRYIPVYEQPKNDSLDFVQTIGRLYYDRKDHKDLVSKMISYFLDHVREKYRLQTDRMNTAFIKALHAKSGYPEKDIYDIFEFINYSESAESIEEHQLARFHSQLESFYKNT